MSWPISKHTPALCCREIHGSNTEHKKRDGDGVKKDGKRQKLQRMLEDSSTAVVTATLPLSAAPTVEGMFGDLLQDGPVRVSPRCFLQLKESVSIQVFEGARSEEAMSRLRLVGGVGGNAFSVMNLRMLSDSAHQHAWTSCEKRTMDSSSEV